MYYFLMLEFLKGRLPGDLFSRPLVYNEFIAETDAELKNSICAEMSGHSSRRRDIFVQMRNFNRRESMRKGLTEVVFILDRSGSMSGLEEDTIGGFNSMIERQKKEEGEALISAVLFDDRTEVLYDRVEVQRVEPMTDRQYYVRGCTALLDAVGGAVHHIGNVHKYAREEDRPEKTLFIITTDGMENASCRYHYEDVKKMIERQSGQYGWEFLFLGANIDAAKEAGRFGIRADRAVNYECDRAGTQLNYEVLSATVSAVRRAPAADMDQVVAACCAPIREDYKKRHRKQRG